MDARALGLLCAVAVRRRGRHERQPDQPSSAHVPDRCRLTARRQDALALLFAGGAARSRLVPWSVSGRCSPLATPCSAALAALLLFALALGVGMSVSHVLSVAAFEKEAARAGGHRQHRPGALFFAQGWQGLEQLRAVLAFTPPHLVTAVAVAATPSAAFIPLITLLAISAPVCYLLLWSFRRSLFSPTGQASGGHARLTACSGFPADSAVWCARNSITSASCSTSGWACCWCWPSASRRCSAHRRQSFGSRSFSSCSR